MVGAQRHGRGSSLGTGSRGVDLEGLVGLPLNVFKYQKNMIIPRERVSTNPYLSSKLNDTSSTTGTTTPLAASPSTLRIKVTSPAMVDAFLLACREVCGSEITRYEVEQADQLHLYSAASETGVPRLQGLCENVIATRFTPKRFVAAVRIALRHGRDSMLRLCYFWFKTQGATDHEAYLRRLDYTTTEKAMDDAFTTETITQSQLFYHRETREISAGGAHRFSIDVFNSTLQMEHLRKSHLFRPPIPMLVVEEEEESKKEDMEVVKKGGESETVDETVDDRIVDKVTLEENVAKAKAAKAEESTKSATNAREVGEGEGEGEGETKSKEKDTTGEGDSTKTDAGATTTREEDKEEQKNEEEKNEEEQKSEEVKEERIKSSDPQIQSAIDAKGFDGLQKCQVIRERRVGPNKDMTRYTVLNESDGKFLVSAVSSGGTNFVFSLDPDNVDPTSPDVAGTMDCSFTGTTFTLRDYGMSPDLLPDGCRGCLPSIDHIEHCVVLYETNILGRVPNAMMVHIPHGRMSPDAEIDDDVPYHKLEAAENDMLAIVTESGPDFSRLQTRKPIWSDDLEAWTMDFHGRVKLASKKNFLLVSETAPTEVLMLFGKVAKTHFSLDFKAPMTVMQAFAIALTSFADKMLVT